MVQGVSSWAGKSLLTTALARHFSRLGLRVAPFKGLNMSNNARVVEGGEIGVAQYLQALAARVEPDVRMNPVLLKPEADDRSEVVVLGRPDPRIGPVPWRERPGALWPVVEGALAELLDAFDLVVIEGAGSPAEINLADADIANMRVAERAQAPVLLVADIDRGGAFAHLYGTWALLPPAQRALVRGFVLNKFRGDAGLLAPGPADLEALTGTPTLGVLPWLHHALPDEDGAAPCAPLGGRSRVVVLRYPRASNLDELKPLQEVADVVWATSPDAVHGADLVILPGSKHVAADLRWLRTTGLDRAVADHARSGCRLLGLCGGLQLLGERLEDPAGVDGAGDGLGLLPLVTTFAAEKATRRTTSRFGELPEPWSALSGRAARGYEIRRGTTRPTGPVAEALPGGLGWVAGSVLGVYVHGLLEDPDIVQALLGARPRQQLDATFDALADAVAEHLDMDRIGALAGVP
jgi:adenosylcobyric acid synthase